MAPRYNFVGNTSQRYRLRRNLLKQIADAKILVGTAAAVSVRCAVEAVGAGSAGYVGDVAIAITTVK